MYIHIYTCIHIQEFGALCDRYNYHVGLFIFLHYTSLELQFIYNNIDNNHNNNDNNNNNDSNNNYKTC